MQARTILQNHVQGLTEEVQRVKGNRALEEHLQGIKTDFLQMQSRHDILIRELKKSQDQYVQTKSEIQEMVASCN